MADKKAKDVDYFPDFNYRFFPIVFEEKAMEGIQGPVYAPSGEIMDLEGTRTVEILVRSSMTERQRYTNWKKRPLISAAHRWRRRNPEGRRRSWVTSPVPNAKPRYP
jgi:hypothetical protein